MYRRRLYARLIAAAAIAACCAEAGAREWSVYTSENFTLYSDRQPQEAARLLENVDLFHRAVLKVTALPETANNTQVRILVYAGIRDFGRMAESSRIAGGHGESLNGPWIVVGPDPSIGNVAQVLRHQYVHHVVAEHATSLYPRWYSEGIAEVLAETSIEGDVAYIGLIPESHETWIGRLGDPVVRELLEPGRSMFTREPTRFYAWSWLLTHYLLLSEGSVQLRDQARDYLARYGRGEPPVSAFEASFSMSPEDFDDELRKYRRQTLNALVVEVGRYDGKIAQAQLTPNEQAFLLADMAWRVDRESAARKYLRKLDVDAKDAARPLSLSVVLHHHAAEYEAARKLAEQAIALAADDAVVLANLSHWQWDSYCNAQVHGTDGRVRLDAVRSYATEALRLDPGSLAARKYLWLALLEQGDRPAALRTMTGAYELEPRNRDLNLAMGRFLAESSEPAHALPFLERALGWSHVDEERDEVEALIVAVATGKPVPRAPACSSSAGEWR